MDRRDALIQEQAARLEAQAEQIAALEALVADLREQLDAALRASSRNSSAVGAGGLAVLAHARGAPVVLVGR